MSNDHLASAFEDLDVNCSQTSHRINILRNFGIGEGAKVLELGCGQGDTTILLARLVGPSGRITAIDPAPLNYGSPETLGDAQARHKRSDIGERIDFVQADPIQFLRGVEDGFYDVVVLVHSLWYFPSSTTVLETLKAAKPRAKTLCIAEWSLSSSHPAAFPHILAALTQSVLSAHDPDTEANIRSPLGPQKLKLLAEEAGWKKTKKDGVLETGSGVEDGEWESKMVLGDAFLEQARQKVDARVLDVLVSMQVSLQSSVDAIGDVRKARGMDVWVGVFE